MNTSNANQMVTNAVIASLLGNIGTLQTQTNTEDLLTTANQELTSEWTDFNEPGANSFTQGLYSDFNNKNTSIATITADIGEITSAGTDSKGVPYVDEMSTGLITALMGLLGKNKALKTNQQSLSTFISQLNQFSTFLGTLMQNAVQPTQLAAKEVNSDLQNSANAQQTLADIGTTENGVMANVAGLLQNQY